MQHIRRHRSIHAFQHPRQTRLHVTAGEHGVFDLHGGSAAILGRLNVI